MSAAISDGASEDNVWVLTYDDRLEQTTEVRGVYVDGLRAQMAIEALDLTGGYWKPQDRKTVFRKSGNHVHFISRFTEVVRETDEGTWTMTLMPMNRLRMPEVSGE